MRSLQTVHRAPATATRVVQAVGGAAFVAAIEAEVDALIGPRRADAEDFEAVEQAVRHQVLGIAAQAMARRFNGRFRPFGFDQSVRLRPDGALRRPPPEDLHHAARTADAGTGLLPLRRLPYGGVSARPDPGDASTSLPPATTRMVGLTAAEVRFAKTSELLAVLAGVEVETRQVERTAEALGREVADDERAVTEQTAPAPAPTLYLGMDGTGVPVRPAEGRRASREVARQLGQDS